jgi:carboxyl-terminal processing protease
MQLSTFRLLLCFIFSVSVFSACKKTSTSAPPTDLTLQQLNDSVLIYTKDIYLWYSQIPTTFSTSSFADPAKLMEGIRQYSIDPGFQAVDRWSFGIKKSEWDNLSAGIGSIGTNSTSTGNFGITVFWRATGDLRVGLVERQSPAGTAGIERAWRIIKINGTPITPTSNTNIISNNVYNAANTTFTFQKPDGKKVDISLTTANYFEEPVYLDSVYSIGYKKIGYLVFNSFLGDAAKIFSEFNRVFSKFSSNNVSDIVVDLRYNGGGYISVVEKLADYLASSSANGGLMMKQLYNDKYTQYNTETYFHKTGSLNPDHIFFIVSHSTASASELLINSLKPYMNVKLIGHDTYGKPVGFFPYPIGDWYVFPISFRSVNKNGEGNYFDGFKVNSKVDDGLDKNWGDVTETSLANVIKYISTGLFRLSAIEQYNEDAQVTSGNAILDRPLFKGLVGKRNIR